MYRCESWTIKKAESRTIDAFELWCWRRLLRVPWTAGRSNQSILKEINPEYSWEDCCESWSFTTLATLFSFCLQSFPTSGAFWWGGSSHQVAKVLKLQLSQQSSNEYSGLISFKIDCFDLLAIQGRDSQGTSPTPQFESINSLVFSLLYGLTLTSACDYWKNHSFDYTDLCQQSDVCFLIHCLVLS